MHRLNVRRLRLGAATAVDESQTGYRAALIIHVLNLARERAVPKGAGDNGLDQRSFEYGWGFAKGICTSA